MRAWLTWCHGGEKSHNLLFAIWRLKKANGIIHSDSKGLSAREQIVNPSLKAGGDEMSCSRSSTEAGKKGTGFSFLCPCSFQTLNGLDNATPTGEGRLPPWDHRFQCRSHPEPHLQTHIETGFHRGAPWPTLVDT